MRFSFLLSELLLSALVFATPTPTAEEEVSPVELAARADISSILSTITGDIGSPVNLLNPTTLSNIEIVINNLALLLDQLTTNQTKSLINAADQLRSGPLLGELSRLVTQSFMTEVLSLINNANSLLTPQFVNETTGLINNVAPESNDKRKLPIISLIIFRR